MQKISELDSSIKSDIKVMCMDNGREFIGTAIWDTGATFTNITKRVAQYLGVPIDGRCSVCSLGRTQQYATAMALTFPGNMGYCTIVDAVVVDEIPGGVDAVIGLDVILLGEFSIVRENGCLWVKFVFNDENFQNMNSTNAMEEIVKMISSYKRRLALINASLEAK